MSLEWKDKPDVPGVYELLHGSVRSSAIANFVEMGDDGRIFFFGNPHPFRVDAFTVALWRGPIPKTPPPPEPLRECPCCDSSARFMRENENQGRWRVECMNANCLIVTVWHSNASDLRKVWNRRPGTEAKS